jgi:hypothetical protein
MISFVTKMTTTDPQSPGKEAEDNRFEQIRKAAAERRKKSNTDEARVASARQMAKDNRLP